MHAVHDLDAAGDAYARLGFTVGARNRHPWGTHNRIVQFPGVFIELLSIGEMERISPARPGSVSFGTFTRDFLARGQRRLSNSGQATPMNPACRAKVSISSTCDFWRAPPAIPSA